MINIKKTLTAALAATLLFTQLNNAQTLPGTLSGDQDTSDEQQFEALSPQEQEQACLLALEDIVKKIPVVIGKVIEGEKLTAEEEELKKAFMDPSIPVVLRTQAAELGKATAELDAQADALEEFQRELTKAEVQHEVCPAPGKVATPASEIE